MARKRDAANGKHAEALAHLGRDRRMRALVEKVGPPTFHEYPTRDHLECLLVSIVSQQLSGKAAATIFERFRALAPRRFPDPRAILRLPDAALRGAGLSRAKAASIRDLCEAVLRGRLDLGRLGSLPDDEVVEALVRVKGIGVWTAQMALIFTLGRPDVWPAGDLGVRKSLGRFLRLPEMPSPAEAEPLGDRWRPYRSYAAWYLWQFNDTK